MVEILAVGVARVVKMNVGIDATGQHEQSAGVQYVRVARQVLADLDDLPAGDADVQCAGVLLARKHDLAIFDDHFHSLHLCVQAEG